MAKDAAGASDLRGKLDELRRKVEELELTATALEFESGMLYGLISELMLMSSLAQRLLPWKQLILGPFALFYIQITAHHAHRAQEQENINQGDSKGKGKAVPDDSTMPSSMTCT
jgi:hypothetical protein